MPPAVEESIDKNRDTGRPGPPGDEGEMTMPQEAGAMRAEDWQADQFLSLDNREQPMACMTYLSYQCQRVLHSLFWKMEFTWEEFVAQICRSRKLSQAVRAVLRYAALWGPLDELDFCLEEEVLCWDELDGDFFRLAMVFGEEELESLGQALLLRVEREHHAWLAEQRGGGYSWGAYLTELRDDAALWERLLRAWRNCARHMDFAYLWCCPKIPEAWEIRQMFYLP